MRGIPCKDRFILRGATLFTVWNAEPRGATRDIALLASGNNSPALLKDILTAVCAQAVKTDGVGFLLETLQVEERGGGRAYPGLHIEMLTAPGTARPRLEEK